MLATEAFAKLTHVGLQSSAVPMVSVLEKATVELSLMKRGVARAATVDILTPRVIALLMIMLVVNARLLAQEEEVLIEPLLLAAFQAALTRLGAGELNQQFFVPEAPAVLEIAAAFVNVVMSTTILAVCEALLADGARPVADAAMQPRRRLGHVFARLEAAIFETQIMLTMVMVMLAAACTSEMRRQGGAAAAIRSHGRRLHPGFHLKLLQTESVASQALAEGMTGDDGKGYGGR